MDKAAEPRSALGAMFAAGAGFCLALACMIDDQNILALVAAGWGAITGGLLLLQLYFARAGRYEAARLYGLLASIAGVIAFIPNLLLAGPLLLLTPIALLFSDGRWGRDGPPMPLLVLPLLLALIGWGRAIGEAEHTRRAIAAIAPQQ